MKRNKVRWQQSECFVRSDFPGTHCISRAGVAGLAASLAMSVFMAGCAAGPGSNWPAELAGELSVMGHRNWIVVADSAYPAQSRAGIKTIATGAGQIEVVKAALKAVDECKHVSANVYLDAEAKYVPEQDAPGMDAYRQGLAALLGKRAVKTLPHEELIAKLDEAAKTFRVLILKTDLTLPYTSVFLELDCGYWNADLEKKMREKIKQEK